MNIIKLNAIGSTNNYLKEFSLKNDVENYTIVVAKNQTKGRGQMGNEWYSEASNSLTFSMFLKFDNFKINDQFYISMAISLAIYNVLQTLSDKRFYIKWPNDIMAGNKKIGGILIENVVKGVNIKNSIVGIGLNINQEKFEKDLPKATSLKMYVGNEINTDELLIEIINSIKLIYNDLTLKNFDKIKSEYLNVLYKIQIPAMFKSKNNNIFLAKIVGISVEGKLQIQMENGEIQEFGLKEIEFKSML